MKAEERKAQHYLEGLNLGSVQLEPDGNVPPDFRVGASTAVEVRRLNQHYFGDDDATGLEELAIPMWTLLGEETREFDGRFDGRSYWVSARFGRPIRGRRRETSKSVRDSLENFLNRGGQAPEELVVSDHLRLTVYSSVPVKGRVFRLAGGVDRDSGGWLVPMYVDNISHCIQEKSAKIAPYEDRYDIWWLLLVDFLGWGIDEYEESDLRSGIPSLERFSRVIVIDNQQGYVRLSLESETA